jgi:uncharacterized repeat protein (TIGR03833 family)
MPAKARTLGTLHHPFGQWGYNERRLSTTGEQCMDGTRRSDIRSGLRVSIVMKKDQQTGKLTEGIVRDILTNSAAHPHGIKVRLESGEIGRVKQIL